MDQTAASAYGARADRSVKLVIADAHAGLAAAVRQFAGQGWHQYAGNDTLARHGCRGRNVIAKTTDGVHDVTNASDTSGSHNTHRRCRWHPTLPPALRCAEEDRLLSRDVGARTEGPCPGELDVSPKTTGV